MTGDEHYAEAERLVEAAKTDVREASNEPQPLKMAQQRALVALEAAAVHAALAKAAFIRDADLAGELMTA